MNEALLRKIIREEIEIYLEIWNAPANELHEDAHIVTFSDKRTGDVYRRVSERIEGEQK